MKENRFQIALRDNGAAFGHMIMEFGTRGIARILEAADLDFAVIDMEHSSFDADRIGDLMAWFSGTNVAPFVRVPELNYHFIARSLDAGALGIMVPNIETEEQARNIVQAAKYAPMGVRGVGLGTAHTDYKMPNAEDYLREANERTIVICQIESPRGVENVEAIANVPGVDCLWVGHFDLSHAMGIPAQFKNDLFLKALTDVVRAANRCGKTAGAQPGSLEQAEEWWDLGFRVLSWRSDIALYRAALHDGVEKLRGFDKRKPQL
jgi:2-dehydro-3-deoxyglucarate aldolase/4-hydroxy-2-oxoheptanedioate aldolase